MPLRASSLRVTRISSRPGSSGPTGALRALNLVHEDLDEDEDAAPDPPPASDTAGIQAASVGRTGSDEPNGVQPLHVVPGTGPVDNWPDGVQQLHPGPRTGCNWRIHGVQRTPHGVQRLHPNRP